GGEAPRGAATADERHAAASHGHRGSRTRRGRSGCHCNNSGTARRIEAGASIEKISLKSSFTLRQCSGRTGIIWMSLKILRSCRARRSMKGWLFSRKSKEDSYAQEIYHRHRLFSDRSAWCPA